jgi:hypothetical protein
MQFIPTAFTIQMAQYHQLGEWCGVADFDVWPIRRSAVQLRMVAADAPVFDDYPRSTP